MERNVALHQLKQVDEALSEVIALCSGSPSREKVSKKLKATRQIILKISADSETLIADNSTNVSQSPDFNALVTDPRMREILIRRWSECEVCINNRVVVGSLVMIGGLLEALLLAKVNQTIDKSPIFTAQSAPRDKAGKTLQLKEWSLKDYIEVAHELSWITQSMRDMISVLREYRNYIHPYKELSLSSTFTAKDLPLIWDIAKTIIRELTK